MSSSNSYLEIKTASTPPQNDKDNTILDNILYFINSLSCKERSTLPINTQNTIRTTHEIIRQLKLTQKKKQLIQKQLEVVALKQNHQNMDLTETNSDEIQIMKPPQLNHVYPIHLFFKCKEEDEDDLLQFWAFCSRFHKILNIPVLSPQDFVQSIYVFVNDRYEFITMNCKNQIEINALFYKMTKLLLEHITDLPKGNIEEEKSMLCPSLHLVYILSYFSNPIRQIDSANWLYLLLSLLIIHTDDVYPERSVLIQITNSILNLNSISISFKQLSVMLKSTISLLFKIKPIRLLISSVSKEQQDYVQIQRSEKYEEIEQFKQEINKTIDKIEDIVESKSKMKKHGITEVQLHYLSSQYQVLLNKINNEPSRNKRNIQLEIKLAQNPLFQNYKNIVEHWKALKTRINDEYEAIERRSYIHACSSILPVFVCTGFYGYVFPYDTCNLYIQIPVQTLPTLIDFPPLQSQNSMINKAVNLMQTTVQPHYKWYVVNDNEGITALASIDKELDMKELKDCITCYLENWMKENKEVNRNIKEYDNQALYSRIVKELSGIDKMVQIGESKRHRENWIQSSYHQLLIQDCLPYEDYINCSIQLIEAVILFCNRENLQLFESNYQYDHFITLYHLPHSLELILLLLTFLHHQLRFISIFKSHSKILSSPSSVSSRSSLSSLSSLSSTSSSHQCQICHELGATEYCYQCEHYFHPRCGKFRDHICKLCKKQNEELFSPFCCICHESNHLIHCSYCYNSFHKTCIDDPVHIKDELHYHCSACRSIIEAKELNSNQEIHKEMRKNCCDICNKPGLVMKCSACPATFHPYCVGLDKLPSKPWYCESCREERCQICGQPAIGKSKYIICGDEAGTRGCDRVFHLKCLGLKKVPKGDWYCPECLNKFKTE